MSLVLAHKGLLDIENFKTNNKNSSEHHYSDLVAPCENVDLRDMINCYYASQFLNYGKSTHMTVNGIHMIEDSHIHVTWEYFWNSFCKDLENALQEDMPLILGLGRFYLYEENGDSLFNTFGHTIVACGIDNTRDDYVVITLYDPNTYATSGFGYRYLFISKTDSKQFWFSTSSKQIAPIIGSAYPRVENWDWFEYWDASALKNVASVISGGTNISNTNNTSDEIIEVIINGDQQLELTNDDGLTLKYDKNGFAGNMPMTVIPIYNESNEDTSIWRIQMPLTDRLTITNLNQNTYIACSMKNNYYRVSAENISEITIDDNEGVEINGQTTEFEVAMSSPTSGNLIMISGNTTGNRSKFSYMNDDVKMETDGTYSDVITSIVDIDSPAIYEDSISNKFTTIAVSEDYIIEQASIPFSDATVTGIKNATYTGKPITQNLEVRIGSKVLVQDTDYSVSYENNVNVGTATVTITGKGSYEGFITKTFVISASSGKWSKSGNLWMYQQVDGTYKTNGWEKISGKWYYFDKEGWMQTGWQKISGKWYYFNSSGAMVTGWQKIGKVWYYFNGSGAMVTGWQKISGKWYYFNTSGAMQTGWQKVSGKWYYFNGSGAMQTGWKSISGKWYYFNSSGAMQTGWITVGGKSYYMYSDGHMATSTWIGKYYVDANGVWTKTK